MSSKEGGSKITKSDLNKIFLRSMTFEGSWDYERQMYLANAFTLGPIIKKLYPSKEDRADALKRHLEFFNITPYLATLVCGIVTAMEEVKANGGEIGSYQQCEDFAYGPVVRHWRFVVSNNLAYGYCRNWLLHRNAGEPARRCPIFLTV